MILVSFNSLEKSKDYRRKFIQQEILENDGRGMSFIRKSESSFYKFMKKDFIKKIVKNDYDLGVNYKKIYGYNHVHLNSFRSASLQN